MKCGCHCIRCNSTEMDSARVGEIEKDGYYDMHHTCGKCGTHFNHLDGTVFDSCAACGYARAPNQEK